MIVSVNNSNKNVSLISEGGGSKEGSVPSILTQCCGQSYTFPVHTFVHSYFPSRLRQPSRGLTSVTRGQVRGCQ